MSMILSVVSKDYQNTDFTFAITLICILFSLSLESLIRVISGNQGAATINWIAEPNFTKKYMKLLNVGRQK